jgi:hypothetical protein
MAYEDAQRELTEDHAVVLSVEQREFTDTIMVRRRWENVPLEKSQEYIEYLDNQPRTIVNPDGVPAGTYRVLRNVYVSDEGQREIHQFLAKDLRTAAPITEGNSKWRWKGGKAWQSSAENVILELSYVDPLELHDMVKENTLADYSNAIFTANDGVLPGKWFNVRFVYEINEEEGWATIYWFLSLHYNKDYIFTFLADPETREAHFFKTHMLTETIQTFQDTYYFDLLGNFYISTDEGLNYTNKNGTDTAPTTMAGLDANLLGTSVPRRTVTQQEVEDQETGEVTVHTRLVFSISTTNEGSGGDPIISYGEPDIITRYMGHYVGIDLPDGDSLVGVVASGGRSKTVTRIQNPRVKDGLFYYDLYEVLYTAPQNESAPGAGDDTWFLQSDTVSTQRDKRTAYSAIVGPEGNAGWQPIDGSPEWALIEQATWRKTRVIKERLYLVRKPTTQDYIDLAEYDPLSPVSYSFSSTITDTVGQSGANLWFIERTTTTLGSVETTIDADAVADASLSVYQGSGSINQEPSWP